MKRYLLSLMIFVTTHVCMSGLKDIILRKQVLYHVLVKICETKSSKTFIKTPISHNSQREVSCGVATWEEAIKVARNNLFIEYPQHKIDIQSYEETFDLKRKTCKFKKIFSVDNNNTDLIMEVTIIKQYSKGEYV